MADNTISYVAPRVRADSIVLLTAKEALDSFALDQHRWSTRPCETCAKISQFLSEAWGCYEFANVVAAQRERLIHG